MILHTYTLHGKIIMPKIIICYFYSSRFRMVSLVTKYLLITDRRSGNRILVDAREFSYLTSVLFPSTICVVYNFIPSRLDIVNESLRSLTHLVNDYFKLYVHNPYEKIYSLLVSTYPHNYLTWLIEGGGP